MRSISTLAAVFSLPALAAAATATEAPRLEVRHVNPADRPAPTGLTQAVAVRGGTLVFVSGQVSVDAKGEVVGKGDLKAQGLQVLENLRTALAAVGAKPADIVRTNTYVVNYRPEHLALMRELRAGFFGTARLPASTLVGVQALAREDFLIEIEAVAAVP